MEKKKYEAIFYSPLTLETLKSETEDCYVAFLDVIGFSNIINESDDDLLNFLNALRDWKSITDLKIEDYKQIKMKSISDSIILWTNKETKQLNKLIDYVAALQSSFFNFGILLRGGISSGDVYNVSGIDILLGKGIINAYELEKIASVPRVIIDPNIIFEISENNEDFCGTYGERFSPGETIQYFILRNGEPEPSGIRYVNINFTAQSIAVGFSLEIYDLKNMYEFLKKNIYTDIKNANKYHWIARQCEYSLFEFIRRDEFNKIKNEKLTKDFYKTLYHKFKGL